MKDKTCGRKKTEEPVDEKWVLEEAATYYFLEALNKKEGTAFKKVIHGDRPDYIIEDETTGRRIGVEVTHLYYNAVEARALMGRADTKFTQADDPETYIKRLNELLVQKSKKVLGYDPALEIGLLIRVISPNFDAGDFTRHREMINLPENTYRHIWALFYDFKNNRWGVLIELK